MEPIDFTDKLVVVTGGCSGIGKATVLAFTAHGAKIAVLDINPMANDMRNLGGIGCFFCDVSKPEEVEQVAKGFEHIDILISNAGIEYNRDGDLTTMPIDKLLRILDVNLMGAINCARAFMPKMQSGGRVVFVSSTQAFMACHPGTSYQASKAGLLGLTKSLAIEYARKGITVNAVCPGGIATEGMGAARGADSVQGLRDYRRHNPIGRRGHPEEVAYPILFLCSPWASYITGEALVIDGGHSSLGMPFPDSGESFLPDDPDQQAS